MKRNLAVVVVIVGIIAIAVSWLMSKGDNGVSIQVVHRYEFARVEEPLYYLIKGGGSLHEISQQVSSRPEVINTFSDQGITLLGLATAENRLDLIRMLVEKGADVNAGAGTGTPPIHCAVIYRQYAAAALLIELGADPAVGNFEGFTACEFAATNNDVRMMEILNCGKGGEKGTE